MALQTQAISTFPAADLSHDLLIPGIQQGNDVLASGAAVLAQVNRAQGVVDIRSFGAKVDGKFVSAGASINNGSASVTCPTGTFTNTATDAGKKVYIAGAGPSGGPLLTYIVSVNVGSTTTAVLNTAASTTVSNKNMYFGTDDWAAWMAAINYAIYTSGIAATVLVPKGISIVSQTIYLGYGEIATQRTLNLRGACPVNGATTTLPTNVSCVFGMFHDRPVIAAQGLMSSVIENLLVRGINFDYLIGNNFGYATPPTGVDDTIMANWMDPQITADTAYKSYCGIAIDPYSGPRQGTSFPDVAYDTTFYPSPTQWNKTLSKNVTVRNCLIAGFATGVLVSPITGTASYTDATLLDGLSFAACKWCVSLAGSATRNWVNNLAAIQCGTIITTNAHSGLPGEVTGTWSGFQIIMCITFIDLTSGRAIRFANIYALGLWTLGLIVSPHEVTFSDFEIWSANSHSLARGFPGRYLKANPGTALFSGSLTFQNGSFRTAPSTDYLFYFDVQPEALNFDNVTIDSTVLSAAGGAYRYLGNSLCNGVVTAGADCWNNQNAVRGKRKLRWIPYNLNTGGAGIIGGDNMVDGNYYARYTSRPWCIPVYCDEIGNSAATRASMLPAPVTVMRVLKSDAAITAKQMTGLQLTMTINATAAQMMVGGINGPGLQTGDAIIDGATGTVWVVTAVTGSAGAFVVIANQLNNFKSVDGGFSYTNPETISLTTGDAWYFVNSRIYTTTLPMYCTLASASANLTACGTSNGVNSFMTTDLANNDYVYIDYTNDYWMNSNVASIISALAAGSFTVGTAANVSAVKKRIPYFVRPGPANVLGNPVLTGPWTVTAGVHNVAFSSYVGISGGQSPYTTPTVASGALPTGITLSISGTKLVASGTTTQTGTFNGTVTVKDSQTVPGTSNALAFSFNFT